jgi:O-antigen chain-terminating methyltransferase
MTDQQPPNASIDEIIARIREEAAQQSPEPAPERLSATRAERATHRLKAGFRRRVVPVLSAPLRLFAHSALRPATNRAVLKTQAQLQDIQRLVDDLQAGYAEQASELADLRGEQPRAGEIDALKADLRQIRADLNARLYQLERLAATLEAARDGVNPPTPTDAVDGTSAGLASDGALDAFYLAFENACRGSEAEIAEQMRVDHLVTVQDAIRRTGAGGVLDIGCGRGEWLRLLATEGIEGEGVDLSPMMADHCQADGLSVQAGDAVALLSNRAADSLTAITGFHIIEHLPFSQLYRLVQETARVLRPGGVCIFETPNPENLLVGSHTFYHDPTHSNPLTPTAMRFLAEYHGLGPVSIQRLHPYPEAARVPGHDTLTERVNGHLCGPQDYALVGQKPAP